MGRIYIKKPQKYDEKKLSDAIRAVNNNSLSISKAAKEFNLDRSLLSRRLRDKGIGKRGRKCEFSPEEEKHMASRIKSLAHWGFGLTRKEILDAVQEYVKKNNLKTRFRDGRPGFDWLEGFMKRHNLTLKKPEILDASRRKATSDPFIIYEFYGILKSTILEKGLFEKPAQIWNLDETSFCHDPTKLKIVGEKGKTAHRTTQGCGRANTSVLACVNAAGTLLPPLIIYEGQHLWTSWKANADLPGTYYAVSKKGYMTSELFYEWFASFCRKVKERPLLMIFDGHLSHLSYETVSLALKEDVVLIKLPSHTTDLLQPLDKTCFRPMKVAWEEALLNWQRANSRAMSKSDFADLLCSVWHSGIRSESIVSGFLSTGIYPFNPKKYPVSRLNPEKLARYQQNENEDSAVSNQLQHSPAATLNPSPETQEQKNTSTTAESSSTTLKTSAGTSAEKQTTSSATEKDKENSFDSVLLSKFGKTLPNQTPRRKVDVRAKLVSSENFLESIKNVKVAKQTKKIKKEPGTEETKTKKPKSEKVTKKPKK